MGQTHDAPAPLSSPDDQGELEEIPGLTQFGIHYLRARSICLRAVNMATHIKAHKNQLGKGPSPANIKTCLRKFPLIPDNEPLTLPTTPVAPFSYLKPCPDGFHCAYCSFACPSRRTMYDHCLTHPEARHQPVDVRFKPGHVQRFFTSGTGSSYFKVDPLLLGVEKGSDFDIFYSMVQEETRQKSVQNVPANTTEGADWDLSPFLARAGWVRQMQGYSKRGMMRRVGPLRKNEDQCLKRLPQVVRKYLTSITDQDMVGRVHPANLNKLNNWKSYVSLLITCDFAAHYR